MAGLTETEFPVPAAEPLQEAEYQCHVAPGDSVPFTFSVELVPEQIGEVPVADTGSDGGAITSTAVFTQFEKQFPFSALT